MHLTNQPTKVCRSEQRKLLALVLLGCLLYSCGMTIADPDLWGHTLYGLRAIAQGIWLERTDPFSYTAPHAAWVNHEWLTEYAYGWIWNHAGNTGLWIWRNLAVATVFFVAAWSLRRARGSVAAAICLWVFGALCLANFVAFIRPQLATFALFALVLAILREHWDNPRSRKIWSLPVLAALWVNLHGGFLAGVGLMAVFAGAGAARCMAGAGRWGDCMKFSAVCGLSVAATLLNPYGASLYSMLWDHLIPEQMVREWQPLWGARQSPGYYLPFVIMALALPWSKRWKWIDLLILAVVTVQGLMHIRHIALLCIAVMVLLPGSLSDGLNRLFPHVARQLAGAPGGRWVATLALVLALVALQAHDSWSMWRHGMLPWNIATEVRRDVPGVPARAVRLMVAEGISGNLVTEYGWGQYVLWHLFPQSRVAFDGRYRTVYPMQLERDFLAFQQVSRNQPAKTPLLDQFDTEIALVPTKHGPANYLAGRSDWVKIFADDQAALFVRNTPRFAPLIARSRAGRLAVPAEAAWELFPAGPGLSVAALTANPGAIAVRRANSLDGLAALSANGR